MSKAALSTQSHTATTQRLDTLVFVVILSVTAFGSLMTIVAAALGDIAADLSSSRATMTWAITALMLTMAVATPIGGKLGDLFGYRRVFLIGLLGGSAATVLCSLAWSPSSLIGFRVLFGAFGALVVPNGQVLMLHAFGPKRRSAALGWFQFAMTSGPTVGIIIGGPMIDVVGWRSVFAAFAALNVIALVFALFLVRPVPGQGDVIIDYQGAIALALAVLTGLFAITRVTERARDGELDSAPTDLLLLALVAASVAATKLFVFIERRSPDPMLKVSYFAQREFTMPMLSTASLRFAYMGGFVVTPALLSGHYGWSTGSIALIMIPRPAAFSLASLVGGYLPGRIGLRPPIIIGAALMTASMLTFAAAATQSGTPGLSLIVAGLVLSGVAAGVAVPATGAMVSDAVEERDLGIANGMNQQMMFIGIVAGIQSMNVLVGDDAPTGRFALTYTFGACIAVLGIVAAALARPQSGSEHLSATP